MRPIPKTMGASSASSLGRRWRGSMRINGEWLLFDDDILRPVIRGEILTEAGAWQHAEFLVDTGADRTCSVQQQRRRLDFNPAIFGNASVGWAEPLTPSWSKRKSSSHARQAARSPFVVSIYDMIEEDFFINGGADVSE